jgi:hypothetical protein
VKPPTTNSCPPRDPEEAFLHEVGDVGQVAAAFKERNGDQRHQKEIETEFRKPLDFGGGTAVAVKCDLGPCTTELDEPRKRIMQEFEAKVERCCDESTCPTKIESDGRPISRKSAYRA